MPLEAQAKLLRVLEDGQVDRVGSSQSNRVDVRIIAATNADLVAAIGTGRFRPDLYYRLHVFPIVIPPLRDRPEDIPLLARHFLKYFQSKLKRPRLDFGAQVMDRLVRYPWPGNVRELQNMIERAVILARSSTVEIDDQFLMPPSALAKADGMDKLQELERLHILQMLDRTMWRIYGPEWCRRAAWPQSKHPAQQTQTAWSKTSGSPRLGLRLLYRDSFLYAASIHGSLLSCSVISHSLFHRNSLVISICPSGELR